jgi:two-component system, OmpR family, response regulator RegX3
MRQTKRRILCVDDNDDTCFMLTALFGQLDYETVAAHSVADALALARSKQFDLYVIDYRFPDGTGVELCRKIREFDSRTPILFFSGDAFESQKQEAFFAGAQEYLSKPGDLNEMAETVHRLLRKRGEQATA